MEDPSAPEGDGIDYTNFDFFPPLTTFAALSTAEWTASEP